MSKATREYTTLSSCCLDPALRAVFERWERDDGAAAALAAPSKPTPPLDNAAVEPTRHRVMEAA